MSSNVKISVLDLMPHRPDQSQHQTMLNTIDAARAAGYADVIAPPTFAIILAQAADAALINDESAGIDFSRVVHADQRFTHHRPIVAGDELRTEVHVDSVRVMGAGAMLTTREEIVDAQGEPVTTCISSLLVRAEEEN